MWKEKGQDEQGRYEQVPDLKCQYDNVVIPVVVLIWETWEGAEADIIEEWLNEDGEDVNNMEGVYRWLAQRVNWSGMEATKLCQVFYRFVKWCKGIKSIRVVVLR